MLSPTSLVAMSSWVEILKRASLPPLLLLLLLLRLLRLLSSILLTRIKSLHIHSQIRQSSSRPAEAKLVDALRRLLRTTTTRPTGVLPSRPPALSALLSTTATSPAPSPKTVYYTPSLTRKPLQQIQGPSKPPQFGIGNSPTAASAVIGGAQAADSSHPRNLYRQLPRRQAFSPTNPKASC